MKNRGAISYQGVIPASLRRRWRWVHIGWTVFGGDRFCFVGEGQNEKRGFLPVEDNQVGMKVPRHYQYRFIRPNIAALDAAIAPPQAGQENKP